MPFIVVLFLFVGLELYVLVEGAQWLGTLSVVGLLFLTAWLGLWLLRRHGLGLLLKVHQHFGQNQFPKHQVAESCLLVLGGCLLFLPGFITDLAGLLLLLPPVRRGLARSSEKATAKRGYTIIDIEADHF